MRDPAPIFASILCLSVLAAIPGGAASAQERHHQPGHPPPAAGRPHGHSFYGRSYRSFTPHERRAWHGGRWINGWHDGRFAWWWVVNGWWYVYPQPVYPYPVYVPPAIVVEQAPPQPTGLPPAQFWYFCDNPEGYYPYVASCAVPWRQVPAQPAQ